MEFFEVLTHTFIIKLWIEEPPDFAEPVDTSPGMDSIKEQDLGQEPTSFWRGRITHVPSGQIQHFEESDEMVTFIQTFLTPFSLRRSRGVPRTTKGRE